MLKSCSKISPKVAQKLLKIVNVAQKFPSRICLGLALVTKERRSEGMEKRVSNIIRTGSTERRNLPTNLSLTPHTHTLHVNSTSSFPTPFNATNTGYYALATLDATPSAQGINWVLTAHTRSLNIKSTLPSQFDFGWLPRVNCRSQFQGQLTCNDERN